MKRADEILAAGAKHLADRAATRDQPEGERSMARTVAAFNAMYGKGMTVEQGWQFMVLLKMARSAAGAFNLDDYEDGAAYFALAAEDAYRERVATGGIPTLDTLRAFAPAPGKEFVVKGYPCGSREPDPCVPNYHHPLPDRLTWADAPEWAQWFKGQPKVHEPSAIWWSPTEAGLLAGTFESKGWRESCRRRPPADSGLSVQHHPV